MFLYRKQNSNNKRIISRAELKTSKFSRHLVYISAQVQESKSKHQKHIFIHYINKSVHIHSAKRANFGTAVLNENNVIHLNLDVFFLSYSDIISYLTLLFNNNHMPVHVQCKVNMARCRANQLCNLWLKSQTICLFVIMFDRLFLIFWNREVQKNKNVSPKQNNTKL